MDWKKMEKAVAELIEADKLKSQVIDDLFSIVLQTGCVEDLDRRVYDKMEAAARLTDGLD